MHDQVNGKLWLNYRDLFRVQRSLREFGKESELDGAEKDLGRHEAERNLLDLSALGGGVVCLPPIELIV